MAPRDAYFPLVISLIVVDSIAVGLRLWARSLKKALGYDDYTMTVALYFTTAPIVYILTTGITKLGVGLVLYRLANGADMRIVRIILLISMVILVLWFLVTDLIFALQCRPLSVAWGVGKGDCVSTAVLGATGICISAMDMAISWFYALLPIYMLYRTQLPLKLKIMVIILLGLGALSSIVIIVRLKYLLILNKMTAASGGLATQDAVLITIEGTIYSILEIGLSILAASLTALRPLLKKIPCLGDVTRNGSGPKDFGSLVTFGNSGQHNKGPAYRLEDRGVISDADSQENIIPTRPNEIVKQTDVELSYSPADMKRAKVRDGEAW
ncbi:hypothetical protein F53441_13372 [Fusarium austroafricanum]|uniref:Rhodopsin domain-containing protein n=1 Tax=Fusarium austroafricanum TaxID=2364996 RepID=A0A8H4NFN0_9HYPO|nr:hypothetical protein F53441_13372 [Fusarium austroafricanum]